MVCGYVKCQDEAGCVEEAGMCRGTAEGEGGKGRGRED